MSYPTPIFDKLWDEYSKQEFHTKSEPSFKGFIRNVSDDELIAMIDEQPAWDSDYLDEVYYRLGREYSEDDSFEDLIDEFRER